jgi:hypothetical protein
VGSEYVAVMTVQLLFLLFFSSGVAPIAAVVCLFHLAPSGAWGFQLVVA